MADLPFSFFQDSIRWDGTNWRELGRFLGWSDELISVFEGRVEPIWVRTAEGDVRADPGDTIAYTWDGQLFVLKPDT